MSIVVYLYLPVIVQFSGELIFGFKDCQIGIQDGGVSRTVCENSIIGDWNGSVEGVGGNYKGVLSEDGKIYLGA